MQLTPSWTRVQDKSSIKAGPLTGVHSIGGHSFPFSDAGHFLTEVDVSELAAAVGEEGQLVVVEVLEVQFLTLKDRLPRCLATSVSAPESSCGSDSELWTLALL
ncbi:hypothetical protein F7725_013178 [Dissostichus mawsoni]|uniref:Uncharacterized protein n=1 Tax=Dissostichus mawsoni TaxID=36200 RepID=A0A7J5YPI3_DISMA|nr:hypothetical protein F7725_013178 [Dissostichus mawsoni]